MVLECEEEGTQWGCLWVFEGRLDFVEKICYVAVVVPRDLNGRLLLR